jgi:type 1 glutamine amidotransferase
MSMHRTIRAILQGATTLALAAAASQGLAAQQPAAAPEPAPAIPGQDVAGLHVYLRAGLKTHGPGAHDYPQFLADWSKLLTEHGAVVDGSFHSPTEAELAGVDVIVMFKGDAGYMGAKEKAALDAFVKRGGGIVSIHDSLCGPDPKDFALQYVGGGKRHGETNFTNGDTQVAYVVTDPASPIMKGVGNLSVSDEAFYKMDWAPSGIHVLATNVIVDNATSRRGGGAGQTVPQIWTYEHTVSGGVPARAFAWMQGHAYTNFAIPQVQDMLLRGIAWAAKHPVDELVDYKPPAPPARRGGGAPTG